MRFKSNVQRKAVMAKMRLSGERYRVLAVRPSPYNDKSASVMGDFNDKRLAFKNAKLIKKYGGNPVSVVDTKKQRLKYI